MTAIGLSVFVVFFVLAHACYSRYRFEQTPSFYIFVLLYIVGALLMLVGIARWLWKFMP